MWCKLQHEYGTFVGGSRGDKEKELWCAFLCRAFLDFALFCYVLKPKHERKRNSRIGKRKGRRTHKKKGEPRR